MPDIEDVIHSWNPTNRIDFDSVKVECDTLREGMQGAFAHKPDIEERKLYLSRLGQLGVESAMVSFPASSPADFRDSQAMLAHVRDHAPNLALKFLARATERDLSQIADLADEFPGQAIKGEFFLGCSPIRRLVEGWSFRDLLDKIEVATKVMTARETTVAMSVEDGTRTPPKELDQILEAAIDGGVASITLCDTAGESTPDGVRRLVGHARERATRKGFDGDLSWHGHNDRGLALANAIAAVEASASEISGTFLGLGERTGNTALEQFIVYGWHSGCRKYAVDQLVPLCRSLAKAAHFRIPDNGPMVGEQAFATSTGTHTAAVLKARELGTDFEDLVFSSVPASALGLKQDIRIGPLSGKANALEVLERLGLDASPPRVEALLSHAKQHDRILSDDDVRRIALA